MQRYFKRALLVGACIFFGHASAAEPTLDEVTVTGFRTYNGGFGFDGFSWYGDISRGAGEPMSGYYQMIALQDELEALLNVRCSGGRYRNVTSHDDRVIRWLAAETVFRAGRQTQSMFQRIFGPKNGPFQGGTMKVTFADGGTELYLVTNPLSSSALPGGAIDGTLKMGNGVVQPHSVCG